MAARPASPKRSKVVIVRSGKVQREWGRVVRSEVERMLEVAMKSLLGVNSEAKAWEMLFSSKDVVAIKVNCIAGSQLCSHPVLVELICRRLMGMGIKPENIFVYDRTTGELMRCGYPVHRGPRGIQVFGTDGDYGSPTESGSWRGRLSRILLGATALINVPIIKDHGICGVTLALKNHLGTCNNPASFHPHHGNPFIADLNAHPEIKEKTRLVICDALRGMFNGGPGFRPRGAWAYNGIIASLDPVAHDFVGLQIIEAKRREKGLPPVGAKARYIATAERRGVGVADPSKIELIMRTL